jgi:hypothetical protein
MAECTCKILQYQLAHIEKRASDKVKLSLQRVRAAPTAQLTELGKCCYSTLTVYLEQPW